MRFLVTLTLLLAVSAPVAFAADTSPVAPVAPVAPAPVVQASPTPTPSATAEPITPISEPVTEVSAAPVVISRTVESELAKVSAMLKALDFKGARNALLPLDLEFQNNADINNLLGFASRKLKQYKASAIYYDKALKINPNHLGALEYQGELFVVTKKLASAKKNLKKIEKLAGKNSEEAIDLRKAISGK